ncbi:MAG TPA: CocE/NonD family hydrolase [Thermoleophilaceae bacterium]|nr:CocE/NonD family hydrolase [Thermoleophilaceae bacterium]
MGALRYALLAIAVTLAIALATGANAAEQHTDDATKIPPGATWTQAYIPSTGGVRLHADVLRPKGYTDKDRTPVIVSIGPYFNHSGQTGVTGPVEEATFDPLASPGPSTRFYDFETGGDLFKRGYSFVMVDLRDFGGSNGCLDWGGPGEQADVKAAVEWAATRKWSTGRVGTYGKSYDGVTGLIAENLSPKGLEAVVSQEPVYDLYRYLYMNRVRFVNSLLTPGLYDAIAGSPGTASDTVAYNTNAINETSRPGCPVFNHADQQDENHGSSYWKVRNLIPGARKGHTPLFMTQGFIENNTKPDGAFDYFNAVKAPKRGWFGQWEHVRGNDRDEDTGRLRMGRKGWFDEVMRFYDRYLKGKRSSVKDPKLAVQSSDGRWRAEKHWPPRDSFKLSATLNAGSYVDNGENNGTTQRLYTPDGPVLPENGDGIWTFSPVLDHEVHHAGKPHVKVTTEASVARGNLVVNTYDVDRAGNALLINRGAYLLDAGTTTASFDLYPNDWILTKGHRLGVLVTSSNAEWWAHAPTGQSITVKKASISMPFVSCARPKLIQGRSSIFLDEYEDEAPFPVDAATIKAAQRSGFPLPGPLQGCQAAKPSCLKDKLRFKIHQPERSRIVQVDAYVDGKHVKRVKGDRITTFSLKRPKGKNDFVLKIVTRAANGQRNVSVRTYHRCTKTNPDTHTIRP